MDEDDSYVRIRRKHWELEFDLDGPAAREPPDPPEPAARDAVTPAANCVGPRDGPAASAYSLDAFFQDLQRAWLGFELWVLYGIT